MLISCIYDDSCLNFKPTGMFTHALNVSSYNYLGFAHTTGGCTDAVETSIQKYGMSAPGSCLESGNLDLHVQAKVLMARFVGQEASVINLMGFVTNLMTNPAIMGGGSSFILDECNHLLIRFSVRIGVASVQMFKNNDMADLGEIVVEGDQPRSSDDSACLEEDY